MPTSVTAARGAVTLLRREPRLRRSYDPAPKEEILRAYNERASLGGLTRGFGVSPNTVTRWLEKS
jgi:transposase-like protein